MANSAAAAVIAGNNWPPFFIRLKEYLNIQYYLFIYKTICTKMQG